MAIDALDIGSPEDRRASLMSLRCAVDIDIGCLGKTIMDQGNLVPVPILSKHTIAEYLNTIEHI